MDEPTRTPPPPDGADRARARRPYLPPGIAWDELWDGHANLMAACGQKDIMQSGCDTNPTS